MTQKNLSRRDFLKRLGIGSAAVGAALSGCTGSDEKQQARRLPPTGKMTYRTNPTTGDRVSLLGYGCMRWPTRPVGKEEDNKDEIDQEQVNRLVDYAIEHGVNYFDTSPAYSQGRSEAATGIALARHPRDSYYIATKLSNFAPATWSREAGIHMYRESLRLLQTDYIDYMLLHAIGMTANDAEGNALSGMEAFEARYIENGLLDFLLAEREAGRIRNLGFSYHGDIEVFDRLLAEHDRYRWDFVQIQLNYVDWKYAKEINPLNTSGEYLYGELQKRGIPAVIMEPLLGGRLARVPEVVVPRMKAFRPDDSVASWAFRYAGSPEGVLTVLSGMTYMEHLQDNLLSYAPLEPCTPEELDMLADLARIFVDNQFIPCTRCQYCMPCPYGVDIPSIFAHYNRCIDEGYYKHTSRDADYVRARRAYLVGYDRSVPRLRQASHCIGCGQCTSHCPQRINIPGEMRRIDDYIEKLKQNLDFDRP